MTNNYVDTKVTIWTRAYFTEDTDMQTIVQMIKEGDHKTGEIYDNSIGFIIYETLYDTEVHISPEDNHGDATVEVYQLNETIWENSIKKEHDDK